MTLELDLDLVLPHPRVARLTRTADYPRLRFMGSKYRVVPQIVDILGRLAFDRVLDGFSGSGVVSYALKEMGKEVISNDFLHFPATVATAAVENNCVTLDAADISTILSENTDSRDFISRTFAGLYFPANDLEFLDSAWSHVAGLPQYKRELALAALCLAAARKQPRGVFTIKDVRYDDGRRNMRLSLRDLFIEAVADYNRSVFNNGRKNQVVCGAVIRHLTLVAYRFDRFLRCFLR